MRTQSIWPSLLVAVGTLILIGTDAPGDVVVFKDGFIMQGKVKQQGSFSADPESGQPFWMPQGSFIIDAGARRIHFSHVQVQDVVNKDLEDEAETVRLESRISRMTAYPIYPLVQIVGATAWNEKWERIYKINTALGRVNIKQRLGLLTPTFARVDALTYNWSAFYLTREFSAPVLKDLLLSHSDIKKGKQKNPVARFRLYRFLAQAGLYDQADEELNAILKDMPEEKDKVDVAREQLQKLRAIQRYEDIERAHQVGQHQLTQKQLTDLPRTGLDEKLQVGARALKTYYETTNEKLATARRLLKELPTHLLGSQRRFYNEAAGAILQELTYENVGRLEPFSSLGEQAERDRAKERKPANDPAQLLALAVTGWLLGKDSAEAKVSVAERLWRARQMVLKYQTTEDDGEREQILKTFLKASPTAVDEITQIIGFLPPPQPPQEISTEPILSWTETARGRRKGIAYTVQLPPEYHTGRSYPVLFALHNGGEKPRDMLERLSAEAASHGYILVAPEWEQLLEAQYQYTPEEHAAVLDVLRDLRRRFQVDSDRVFLLGYGEGANMAYDVGLSHPDQFAGVLPVNGEPHFYVERYMANGQLLPFYVVDGDRAGTIPKQNQAQFKQWVPLGYPSLYVSYKGRGIEWFEGEVPFMFDWMDHKKGPHKRATGVPELGKVGGSLNQEFQTLRPTDNHFYWVSTDSIREGNLNDPKNWKNSIWAASLQGRIGEGNLINVNCRSLKQLTIWFTKDMIDYSKSVNVRVNGRAQWSQLRVHPSLATMLEDLYARGDRQRLFWAKVEIDKP